MLTPDGRNQGGQLAALAAVEQRGRTDDVPPISVRAALTDDDPLTRALGRPNREQVVTRRDSIATTLQALELSNGTTLDQMLQAGAQNWIGRSGSEPGPLVRQIFLTAVGRLPVRQESDTANELLGSPATPEGVADLLWVLMMLPEFQLIY